MPNFSKWAVPTVDAISSSARASDAWARIQRRPFSIVFIRDGSEQSAQTVRVEVQNNKPARQELAVGEKPSQMVIVFGVKGHPLTSVADTSMQIGDRFIYESKEYRIISVTTQVGELQGFGEVVE